MSSFRATGTDTCFVSAWEVSLPKMWKFAAEKPVVAHDDRRHRRGSRAHGESGLLVPPRDPAVLSDAIRTLLGDRGYTARLAAAARARVETQFSREAMVAGSYRMYDEVLR
jgi:D-inositol-3-phosphate glycosyltransferase